MKKKGYNITLGIFIGLIAGVIVGIIMPEWANTALSVVASIYMSALKMMIFPLVFTSLVNITDGQAHPIRRNKSS